MLTRMRLPRRFGGGYLFVSTTFSGVLSWL